MKIHAIQTGTVTIRPTQREGQGRGALRFVNVMLNRRWTEPLPIYAWVIEHPEGAIVVDTGETARISTPGYFPVWHPYFKLGMQADMRPDQEIGPQLKTIGIHPKDVRWVVMTHLHTDHAGGLYHFPKSEILVMRRAFEKAVGFPGKVRGFLPHRWPSWFAPKLITLEPQPFGPFPSNLRLTRSGDVVLIPTPGHTVAHVSVVLQDSDLTYFFAGDASYTQQLMMERKVDGVAPDEQEARQTLQRINQFTHETPTVYLPSHDPQSGERLANKTTVRGRVERTQVEAYAEDAS
jgi:glyoxylase-like metal-dependent hydrolase (beta-lactamase superfamily II)